MWQIIRKGESMKNKRMLKKPVKIGFFSLAIVILLFLTVCALVFYYLLYQSWEYNNAQQEGSAEEIELDNQIHAEDEFIEIKDPKQHELIKELVKEEDLDPAMVDANKSAGNPEPELTKGGFADPLFYTSNFKLHEALSGTRILASNPDELENDYRINHVLKTTQGLLNQIEYEGEKLDDLQKVMDDLNKAIQEGVNFGDPLLKEIHKNLTELDKYFNV